MDHARHLARLGIFPVDAALANIGSESASKIVNSREIGLVLGRALDIHHATTGVKSSREIDKNQFGRRNVLEIEDSQFPPFLVNFRTCG